MTDVLTPEALAEIRERSEKATAPPWKVSDPGYGISRVIGPPQSQVNGNFWFYDAEFIAAAPTDIRRLLSHVAAVEAERDRLREALTPSAETKSAYAGEFMFDVEMAGADGEWNVEQFTVPWTTVKEIMAAIRERAALSETPG